MIDSKQASKIMPVLVNINLPFGKCHDIGLLKPQLLEPGDHTRVLAFHFKKESHLLPLLAEGERVKT